MIKILKYLRKIDWLFIALILGITVFQAWCSMTLIDYLQGVIKAITYNSYRNNEGFLAMANSFGGWEALAAMTPAQLSALTGIDETSANQVIAVASSSVGDIWWNAGMMVLFASLSMLAQASIALMASSVSSSLATRLRKKLNDTISTLSMAQLERFSTASLITRTTNDIQTVSFTTVLALRMFFSAPVTAIWAIVKIQTVSGQLTVVTAVGIVIILIFLILMLIFLMPKFKVIQTFTDRLNLVTQEHLQGIRVVRAFNAENYQDEKFEKTNKDLTKLQVFTSDMNALANPLVNLVMNGIALGIYWLGASLVNSGEIEDVATVISYSTLSSMIIMSFIMLMMMFVMFPRAEVSAKRVNEVLDTKSDVVDPAVETLPKEKGTIEFDDVCFRYQGAEEDVLSHISFQVKQGETLAIIGATGSGKSTIIRLLARFYDATSGSVKVDGVDVRELKDKTLRNILSLTPQKGVLFTGTVRSNIKFSDPSMSDEAMEEAARIACADSFIKEMDGGYDARIARGGTNVSGGQRQRLCIARAIARRPEICTFDDSFSALDFKTDLQVRTNLKESMGETTRVIVAQRIGTIMDADQILVLSEGKMVGLGTHKELLQNCQEYRDIALSQLSKEELGL